MRSRAALAILLAAFASGAMAAELRTLFHTPEERARLDRLRRGEPIDVHAAPRVTRAPAVTGFVKRSDGRSTVWIDGVPMQIANPRAGTLLDPRSVRSHGGEDSVRIERKPAK